MLTVVAICSLASFMAGIVDSIAGGGGLLTMPALLLAGVPPHLALGTNKFASTLGTGLALVNFTRSGLVLWRVAALGVGFSLAGAYGGSLLALRMDSAVLGKTLAVLLPVAVLATLMPGRGEHGAERFTARGCRFWLLMPPAAMLVGAYDGFFGPGTGSFFILIFHWTLRMGLIEASATTKAFNLASNIGALSAFLMAGEVWFALALPMAGAGMAGNWLGSRMAIRAGAGMVRKFLAVSLSLLMLSLVWRYFFAG